MEALRLVLRYAHLIGFAVLLGGAVAQYLSGKIRINTAMLWGAGIQVVTGLALAAPLRGGGDQEPDPVKLAVKGVIAVLIFVMVFVVAQAADGGNGTLPGHGRDDPAERGGRGLLALTSLRHNFGEVVAMVGVGGHDFPEVVAILSCDGWGGLSGAARHRAITPAGLSGGSGVRCRSVGYTAMGRCNWGRRSSCAERVG